MAQLDLSEIPDNKLLHLKGYDGLLTAGVDIYAHQSGQILNVDVVIISQHSTESQFYFGRRAGIVKSEIHAPNGIVELPARLTSVAIHSTGKEAANDLAQCLADYKMEIDETEELISRLGDSVQQSETLAATLKEKVSHASDCWIKEFGG